MLEPVTFSKPGSIAELNKQRGSSDTFTHMPEYKLRNKSSLELSPKQSVNKKDKATCCTTGSAAVSK